MLEAILKLAEEKSLTTTPPEANYFINLTQQVESYIDKEVFEEASEEIRAGTNQRINSLYAQAIGSYIQENT